MKPQPHTSTPLVLLTALSMALAAAAGLVFSPWRYPTDALRSAFVPNDAVTLVVGLPAVLGGLWLDRRGHRFGRWLLPGALLYGIYNAVTVVVGLALAVWSWPDLVVLILGGLALVRSFGRVDVPPSTPGALRRVIAGILIGLGGLFLTRAVGLLVGSGSGEAPLNAPELGVAVADLIVTPLWLIAGVALWRGGARGLALGPAVFVQANLLFVGLLAVLVIQPMFTGEPFGVVDFVVILTMGCVCFIPFGWFIATADGGPRPAA